MGKEPIVLHDMFDSDLVFFRGAPMPVLQYDENIAQSIIETGKKFFEQWHQNMTIMKNSEEEDLSYIEEVKDYGDTTTIRRIEETNIIQR